MNAILDSLGVPEKVQAFFNARELLFTYGDHFEQFETGFHRVPTTTHIWMAGDDLAAEAVITSTAMEAIAFLSLNIHKYPRPQSLAFIAIGNLPHTGQLNWIRAHFPKKKFTLVFGNDLIGRLTDIKVAAGLHGHNVALAKSDDLVNIRCGHVLYRFNQKVLSLNAYEKAAGWRTGCRTCKPKRYLTFLDQLKYESNQ